MTTVVQALTAYSARLLAGLADALIGDLESEEKKVFDEVLPQPEQEFCTLEEMLAELDRRWEQSHRQ